MKRRDFLKLIGVVSLYGCYGTVSEKIIRDCPAAIYDGSLKVMLYNIANARGNTDDFFRNVPRDEMYSNLEQIVALAHKEDVDVLCLNECDFDSQRTHNIDQAAYIAKRLCYNNIIRQKIFSVPGWFDLGNAVISKYPLKVNYSQQYGDSFMNRIKHVFKGFVDFTVLDKAQLNFVLTHLDHSKDENRIDEIKILTDYLSKKDEPFVLVGDLNSCPGRKSYDGLLSSGLFPGEHPTVPSYPSDDPKYSIDRILVSEGLSVIGFRAVKGIYASDHLPVVGKITRK